MTDDKRSFTRGEGAPERAVLPDTIFGFPVIYNHNIPEDEIRLVLSDWDEWIQYRWHGPDGEWHTQWGRRGL